MIGLDTNVLVRYLVQDDPAQAAQATREIEARQAEASSIYLTAIVLCETVWVLETAYGFGRSDVLAVLEKVLRTRQFAFEHKDLLWAALADLRAGKGDFSDYLLGRIGQIAGCIETVTLDRGLGGSPMFRVI